MAGVEPNPPDVLQALDGRRRWTNLRFGLFGVAVVLFSRRGMWWPGVPHVFPAGELTGVVWPNLAFVHAAARSLELPLWNPYERAGYAFAADPASGTFDPLTHLLVGWALVMGRAAPTLAIAKMVLLYGIGAAGLAAFGRERGWPTWAQVWSAVAFVLCPGFVGLADRLALGPTVWVGWLLLAIDRGLRRPSPHTGAMIGAVAGLLANAGEPRTSIAVWLLAAPYGVLTFVESVRAGRSSLRAYATSLVWAVVVALALTGGPWLAGSPGVLGVWTTTDVRVEVASLGDAVGWLGPSEHWASLRLYLGTLGTIGLVLAWQRPRWDTGLVSLVGASAFVAACGHGPWVLRAVSPRSLLIVVVLAGVIVAVEGLVELERLRGSERRQVPVTVACVLVALGFIGFVDGFGPRVVLAVTIGGVFLAAFGTPGWRRVGLWCLPCIGFVDLTLAAHSITSTPTPFPDERPARVLARLVGDDDVFRVADFGWAGQRIGSRQGVRDLVGTLDEKDSSMAMLLRSAPHSTELLQAMNVRAVGYERLGGAISHGLQRVSGQHHLYRVVDPWPLAFWTQEVAIAADPNAVLLELMEPGQPRAIFEASLAPPGLMARIGASQPVPSVAPVLLLQAHQRLIFDVSAPQAGVFVVVEAHAPGWRAWVDGVAVELFRVNGICRGLELDAGTHRVELRYRPFGVQLAFVVWLVTLLGLICWTWRRRTNAIRLQL